MLIVTTLLLFGRLQLKLVEPPVTVNWDVAPSQIDKFPEIMGAGVELIVITAVLLFPMVTVWLLLLTTPVKTYVSVPDTLVFTGTITLLLPLAVEIVWAGVTPFIV